MKKLNHYGLWISGMLKPVVSTALLVMTADHSEEPQPAIWPPRIPDACITLAQVNGTRFPLRPKNVVANEIKQSFGLENNQKTHTDIHNFS